LEVAGKRYVVGFTKHAIDAIGRRINPQWMYYGPLGDVYAYLEQCVYFELCELLNPDRSGHPDRSGQKQLAATFYDYCHLDQYWQYRYVAKVLGEENLNPKLGRPYYRLGYCPAYRDEESGLIMLGTMLLP